MSKVDILLIVLCSIMLLSGLFAISASETESKETLCEDNGGNKILSTKCISETQYIKILDLRIGTDLFIMIVFFLILLTGFFTIPRMVENE